jgi:hypothetical protein
MWNCNGSGHSTIMVFQEFYSTSARVVKPRPMHYSNRPGQSLDDLDYTLPLRKGSLSKRVDQNCAVLSANLDILRGMLILP